jgi:threonine aldolase
VAAAVRDPSDEHVARVSLLCLENTHNRHGGVVVPLERIEALAGVARACGMSVHLDGARLWNASVATGVPVREWASRVDSLMMCFSKGLGAPVGSILMGRAGFIHRARRARKQWGGAMRQVGILAAAALHALDHHVERLADDHRRAKRLASGLWTVPGVQVPAPETNIVMIDLAEPTLDRDRVLRGLHARGVWMDESGPRRIRAVTHLDVDDAGIERAIVAFQQAAGEGVSRAGAATGRPA